MNILCKLGFHKPMHHVLIVFDDGTLHKKCSRCGKALDSHVDWAALFDDINGVE